MKVKCIFLESVALGEFALELKTLEVGTDHTARYSRSEWYLVPEELFVKLTERGQEGSLLYFRGRVEPLGFMGSELEHLKVTPEEISQAFDTSYIKALADSVTKVLGVGNGS